MLIQPTTYQTPNPNFGKIGKLGKVMGRGSLSPNKNPYLEKLDKLESWYNKEIKLIFNYNKTNTFAIEKELKEVDEKYYAKLEQLENKYGPNVSWLRRLFRI